MDTGRGVKLTDSYKPEQFQSPCSCTTSSPLNHRQRFQPRNPSVVLHVGFFFHRLPLFKMWSDQLGTVYLPYLARRYPCAWADRALRLSVSLSDTQKDSGYLHTERRVDCLAGCLGSELFVATAENLLGWPKSSRLENWTTAGLGGNVCCCGWCSNQFGLFESCSVMIKQIKKSSSQFSLLSAGLDNTQWTWNTLTSIIDLVIKGCVVLNDWLRGSLQVWRHHLES